MTDSVDEDVTDGDDGPGCSDLQTDSSSSSTDMPPATKKLRKEQVYLYTINAPKLS